MLRQQAHDLRKLDLVHLEDVLHGLVGAHDAAVGRVLQLVLLHVGPAVQAVSANQSKAPKSRQRSTYNSFTAAGRESWVLPSSPCSGVDKR